MISELAKKLVPYVAGEQPHDKSYVKLNTNENPYSPSPEVAKAIAAFDAARLKLYPDPDCTALRDAIAKKEGVERENVFVGNGSDEVLGFAFLALFNKDAPVKFADVTYSFYPVYCELFGLPYEKVPLTDNYILNRQGYADCGGAVFANPNAPTGIWEDVSEYANKNFPVIIDEAYIDFSGKESLAKSAAKSANAVTVKTFSKSYGLAGMRCGYAVASAENIEGINRVKNGFNSYSVNALTQTAALAAIRDKEYHKSTVKKVIGTRGKLIARLKEMGYTCLNSSANFVLATTPDGNGGRVYEYLKENGVLVRFFDAPRLRDKLRITVGTDEEAEKLISALKRM